MKPRPIDTQAQFAKLCPRWLVCKDDPFQMLAIVRVAITTEKQRAEERHWAYDLNRAVALIELREALELEIEQIEEAA